jgi:hypothetical protein
VPQNDARETDTQDERLDESGGLHYQRAHRATGAVRNNDSKTTAGVRSELAREMAAPDQDQRAEHHGGPAPNDEAWLADQGYPKLGQKMQSRVTQVEHGPYAGGTQQGDANSPAKPERRR